jgi:hypothetical protein
LRYNYYTSQSLKRQKKKVKDKDAKQASGLPNDARLSGFIAGLQTNQ